MAENVTKKRKSIKKTPKQAAKGASKKTRRIVKPLIKKSFIERFAHNLLAYAAVFGLGVTSVYLMVGVAVIAEASIGPVLAQIDIHNEAAAFAVSSPCQIGPVSNTLTDRTVPLSMQGCTGVRRFQVSESPNFIQESKVTVTLNAIAPDASFADVSINYASSTGIGAPTPYSIPHVQRTVKALAVLFQYEDANGATAGTSAFETPIWLTKLMFGDGAVGYDGVNQFNSFKDHLFQDTYGSVLLTGQAYPKIVHISLEKFRSFLTQPTPNIKDEIIAAIKKDDPNFFVTHSFDYYFFLSTDTYNVVRATYLNTPGDNVIFALPHESGKSIFDSTIEEVRTAPASTTVVVTRYNVGTVQGVWLSSDTAKVGKNYFTGGSIVNRNATYYYIKLGTPLPDPNAKVIVRYTANLIDRAPAAPNVFAPSTVGVLFHENYHMMSDLRQMIFSQRDPIFSSAAGPIGDAYIAPSMVAGYSLMNIAGTYTPLLHAFAKLGMGYVTPYTLTWGGNATVHLVRPEFSNVADVASQATMIKVPLHKPGDPGFAVKKLNSANLYTGQFIGEDFLLLELRSHAPLPNNHFNFDSNTPSQGLIAYRVIDQDPHASIDSGHNVDEIIDATPPYAGGFDDTVTSSVAFGAASGVYQFSLPELWQDKDATKDTQSFDFLLSAGSGVKTLYARFIDASGNKVGSQTLHLTLSDNSNASQRMPTLGLSRVYDQPTTQNPTQKRIDATFSAPNGLSSIRFIMDGSLVREDKTNTGSVSSYFFTPDHLAAGAHTFTVVLYDKALVSVSATQSFSIPDTTAPTVVIIAPAGGATISGTATLSATATDDVGVTKVEFYIDSTLKSASVASPHSYIWPTAGVANGPHTIQTKAYDAAGNVGVSSTTSITVSNTALDVTLPVVSITYPQNGAILAIASSTIITISFNDIVALSAAPGAIYIDSKKLLGNCSWGSKSGTCKATWATPATAGSHTIAAVAKDLAGNYATTTIAVTTQ